MREKNTLKKLSLLITLPGSLYSYGVFSQWINQVSPAVEELKTITFINSDTGFTSGGFGKMYKTTDGGTNWSLIGNYSAIDIYFFDSNNGYAASVAGSGTMKKTTNGGSSWMTLTPPNSSSIWGTFATDPSTVYFISTDNKVHKSTNGGSSFTSVTLNGSNYPTDIFFTDANNGFIVDQSGKIWKTANAGSSWTNIYIVSGTLLTSVYFVNNNTGFVCGTSGKILKTTDAGSSWTTLITGSTAYLNSIHFYDLYNGLSVGYGGVILQTTDGGTTWVNGQSNTTEHLFSVSYTSANSAVVVGDKGMILKNSSLNSIKGSDKSVSLQIFPNPFSSYTTLQTVLYNTTMKIDNIFGQTMKEVNNISGRSITLQRDNLPGGIYFIRLIQEHKIIATEKILITD